MASTARDIPLLERGMPESGWLTAYLFMWTVISVVAATTTFIALQGTTVQMWFSVLLRMMRYFYVWAVIALAIVWVLHRFPITRRNIGLLAPLHLVLLVVVSLSMPFLFHTENWREWLYGPRSSAFHALNALIYSFVLIGCQMVRYYRIGLLRERDAQRAELRGIRLEKDLSQARIDTLRIQMNPHFLFNALNSISSLIATSSNDEAFRMTGLLGSLLRVALEQNRSSFISLREELDFLQKYIDIEKIRFGDRLKVTQRVPDECLGCRVPSLLLQPIVENVIKHAVSPTTSQITIGLQVTCDPSGLTFEVADNGPGFPQPTVFGCGLRNITERLRLLYGSEAQFSVMNQESSGAMVRLFVPVAQRRQD